MNKSDKLKVTAWQLGTGPAPKGFGVRCTGCSLCKAEGHVPFPKEKTS